MPAKLKIILFALGCLSACWQLNAQPTAFVKGRVVDENNEPLIGAKVIDLNTARGVTSDGKGNFSLTSVAGNVSLEISFIGYKTDTLSVTTQQGRTADVVVVLTPLPRELGAVVVESIADRSESLTRLDIKQIEFLPLPSGNIESMLTSLGASSRNELSAQYSVRGGNFDENLIYVNDIEVYRPLLVKSGQQEGLSFINSAMVSSVQFAAGGFDTRFGDKMASVLDIQYKRPTAFAGSGSLSLLGGSAHAEGSTRSGKFTHITGIRYKTNQYLLNTLETKGDYKPRFFDAQTFLTYDITPRLEVSFLGHISGNYYQVVPKSRQTSFGTYQQALNFTVYYEGQEEDRFNTALGAMTLDYTPLDRLFLKFIFSAFTTRESVTYDILGQYRIDLLDNTIGSETAGDSILNLGVGGSLDHARNFLRADIFHLAHKGNYAWRQNSLYWGLSVQSEMVDDRLKEWQMIDSAGYSVPISDEELLMYESASAHNKLNSTRFAGYLQYIATIPADRFRLYITSGIRFNHWSVNRETVWSPRARITLVPADRNISFHASLGWYHQPPFYKELRDPQGALYRDTRAQKSIHFVLGSTYDFSLWDRPFKFTSEVYYKKLDNLIPYVVDDVDIRYLPMYKARGYAAGIEFKLNGEFVKDAESWASLSFMKTIEDRYNDAYGAYPRPTDQLVNFGMFFQDYLPTNPSYRFHVNVYYGSRLPYSSPDYDNPEEYYHLSAYKRIDIGVSKSLFTNRLRERIVKDNFFEDVLVSAEVFNLFGFNNMASYQWIRTVSNQEGLPNMFAVPNYLTGRLFNLRVSVKF
jgi:hypothetical protein